MSGYYLIRGTDPAGSDRIEVSGEMIVGRSDTCDLTVHEGHPSRRHARLNVDADGLWLEDLESANGTFVNDRPIKARTKLKNGDRVAFDLSLFVVAAPAPPVADDATVLRQPTADDATVLRAPPARPAPEPAAESPAAEPAAKPAAGPAGDPPAAAPVRETPAAPAAASPPLPRSWADPEFQPEGTRMLTAAELKAMAAGTTGTTPVVDIDEPHLVVVVGSAAGAVLTFPPGPGEWSVGTEAARDLRLEDPGISAYHAKITHDGGRWRVIDQMSANGTYVNGDKAVVSYLKDGDRIRFAQVECEFHLPSGKRRKPAASTSGGQAAGNRSWLIAALAAAVTVAVLAAAAWLM
jgi:pSer/pThr/pTyr-binding forkhead associated (FHA) protein